MGVKVKRITITFKFWLIEVEIELSKESIKKAFVKAATFMKRFKQRTKR